MGTPPPLGVSEQMILDAETELGVRFPAELREAWILYNCNEMAGGWRIFPIFDPANPRKTCGSVTYENLKGAWGREVMAQGLVTVADNGTGNQLVLRISAGQAGSTVFHWHHATHKLTAWKPGLASIKRSAAKSRETVLKLQQRFRAKETSPPKPPRGLA